MTAVVVAVPVSASMLVVVVGATVMVEVSRSFALESVSSDFHNGNLKPGFGDRPSVVLLMTVT